MFHEERRNSGRSCHSAQRHRFVDKNLQDSDNTLGLSTGCPLSWKKGSLLAKQCSNEASRITALAPHFARGGDGDPHHDGLKIANTRGPVRGNWWTWWCPMSRFLERTLDTLQDRQTFVDFLHEQKSTAKFCSIMPAMNEKIYDVITVIIVMRVA